MRRNTSRASAKYKRVRTLLFASLCAVLLVGLYGFYQFQSFASRIYTPETQQAGQGQIAQNPPSHEDRLAGEPSGKSNARRGSQVQPTPDDLHITDLQIDPRKDLRSDLKQSSKAGLHSDIQSNSTPMPTPSDTTRPQESDNVSSYGTTHLQESDNNLSDGTTRSQESDNDSSYGTTHLQESDNNLSDGTTRSQESDNDSTQGTSRSQVSDNDSTHGTSRSRQSEHNSSHGTSRPLDSAPTPSHGTVATAPEATPPQDQGTPASNPFAKWLTGYLPGGTDAKKGQTFLLLGVDSRKGEAARSDTIVLATLPPNSNEVYLMSIPRDTRAQVPGHGWTKINHAMSYGGLPLMKKTVEGLLNIQIDHTVTLDFEGFRQIVDNMGGLDVTVEKNMRYYDPTDGTNIRLHAGQTLQNGKQALDYARFRADALADTGRMQRQQRVIRAMIQKGSEPSNWPKLVKTLDILGDHVKTDVPPRDWMALLMRYSSTSRDQVKTLSLTGENRISNKDNLWYFYVDDAELTKIGRQLQLLRRGNA